MQNITIIRLAGALFNLFTRAAIRSVSNGSSDILILHRMAPIHHYILCRGGGLGARVDETSECV
jgi:hypothetical protein